MAREALTLAGAAVGFLIGGPAGAALGAQIGGYVGGIVDPLDPIEGPRLDDLQVTASTYGIPIPLIYGLQNRIAGNVIWSTGLIESKKKKKSGGKGGGGQSVTEYSYRMSLAIALGQGIVPGLRRVWANSKVIFDIENLNMAPGDPTPDVGMVVVNQKSTKTGAAEMLGGVFSIMRFYQGNGTQQVDPTIESHMGAGNAPAYRHTAYLVFEDLQLADFGNAMPNIEVELRGDCDGAIATVGAAVRDICSRAGIENVSSATLTQLLRGYVVSQTGPVYQALAPLARAYNFDIAEQGGQIRCIPRGSSIRGVVPLGDMGATVSADGNRQDPIRYETASDLALPREVAVSYSDSDMDYQVNTQRASRNAGSSENNIRMEFALVLTAREARAIADTRLWEAWGGRRSGRFSVSDRWVRLKPADVIGLPVAGNVVAHRLTQITRGHDGVLEVGAVYDDPEFYQTGVECEMIETERLIAAEYVNIDATQFGIATPGSGYSAPPIGAIRTIEVLETDIIRIRKPLVENDPQMVWQSYAESDLDELPPDATPWQCRFNVSDQDDAFLGLVDLGGLAATPEESEINANAYADANEVTFTGSTAYKFWSYDNPLDDNTGGLSLKIEILRRECAIFCTGGVAGAPANIPASPIQLPGVTRLVLIDMPIVRDTDDNTGFYWVASAESTGWRGANILRSTDGGNTYDVMSPVAVRAVVGDVASALPAGPTAIWDRGNTITVELHFEEDELESVSEINVLGAANAAWIGPADGQGGEIIQFATATLVGANLYELTDLLRGRRGTEHAVDSHSDNEVFVLLEPDTLGRSDYGLGDWDRQRHFKPVSNLTAEADTAAQTFTNTGVGKRPMSPVHVRGQRDSGNDLTITWVRRTRLSVPGLGYGEVPLGEEVEKYRVEILLGMTVVRTVESSTPSIVYTAAQQTADGYTPGDLVDVVVYQLSAVDEPSIGAPATV